MFLDSNKILEKMDESLDDILLGYCLEFEDSDEDSLDEIHLDEIPLDEVAMKRVVRKGKIVTKVKLKKKGFKVVRHGGSVKFVRMTPKERKARRKAARKAWRVGKSARKTKSKRSLQKSKTRIKSLYGSRKKR